MSNRTITPTNFITDYELINALKPFSIARRQAILFAVASDMAPQIIEILDWPTARKLPLNKQMADILNSVPRHIYFDLVFWEIYEGVPVMLTNLARDCAVASDPYEWEEFSRMAKSPYPITQSCDAFMKELARIAIYDS